MRVDNDDLFRSDEDGSIAIDDCLWKRMREVHAGCGLVDIEQVSVRARGRRARPGRAAELSAQDARDLVILTVGNAYLLVVADETQVSSVEAQVKTSKVSLDQRSEEHTSELQ